MRTRTLSNVFTAVAASSLVAATPTLHKHHHHPHQFEARIAESARVVNIAGPTQVVYEFNGHAIDEQKVCQGIQDGSLKWAAGTETSPKCPSNDGPETTAPPALAVTESEGKPTSSAIAVVPTVAVEPASQSATPVQPSPSTPAESKNVEQAATVQNTPSLEEPQSATSGQIETADVTKTTQSANLKAPAPTTSTPVSSLSSNDFPSGRGVDKEFPDGVINCSTFPDDYGPIKVEWAGLGGWSGVQYVTIQGNAITHIDTAISSSVGEKCKTGAMCSYACPPGFQKSQWPSAQGTTGQSVGGLQCDLNGKLRLTNPNLSQRLCIPGTGTTVVQNKLSENAAICRTDYPGTENEVIPLNTQPGLTSPLTCPDAGSYFKHDGSSTTAQYYINNQGVPLEQACIWGSDGTNMGNWAPSYLGVGKDIYGKTFLAIATTAENNPLNYKPLNYSIEIVGNLSGRCKLKDGRYCSGENYDDCNNKGCTVSRLAEAFCVC